MTEVFVHSLGRPARAAIRKASNRYSGVARSKLWIPKDVRPAVGAKVKLHVLTAVARARESLRRSVQRHLISIIKHRRAEGAACTTLAGMAMAGADLQRLTAGGDRQCATGASSSPDVHGQQNDSVHRRPPMRATGPNAPTARGAEVGGVILGVRFTPTADD